MQRSRVHISVTTGFCVTMAISLCVLPLKWVCGWLVALSVHELCHYVAVKACGSDIRELKVTMFGAEIVADVNSAGKEMFCCLVGPAGGLLLLLFRKSLPLTAICALTHSVYNLLPLGNLDGGRALLSLMNIITKREKAENICKHIDRIVRLVLFGAALYLSWRMRWWLLSLFAGVLLFCKVGHTKYTCKRKGLQVQ